MLKLTISMVRLPIPGSDDGKWGEILNQYLSVSLDGSGELQQDSVGRDQLQADSVTSHAIANESIETAHLADGTVTAAKLSDTLQSSLASHVGGPDSSSNEAIAIFDGTSGKLLKSIEGVTVGEGGGITATSMSLVKAGASAAQLYNRTDGAAAVFGAGLNQSVFSFDSAYSLEFRSASRSTVESRVLNSGSIRMKIDGATGNIGVGTASPNAKLDVGAFFASSPIIPAGDVVAAFSASTNTIAGVVMTNSHAGAASDFRFTIQDNTGHYVAFSSPGVGNTEALFGVQKSTADYIFNANGTPRNLVIGTVNATALRFGTNNTLRAAIDSSGRFGIGTTTPSYQLHVIGDQGLTGNLNFLSNNRAMYFDANNFIGHSTLLTDMHVTSGGNLYINIDSNDNSTNAALFIGKDRTSNTGGTQLMKVTESGSVAIGTMTSPTEKLEVDGNVKVTGAMNVAGVQQANVYAGTTAPSSPVVGQIWIDTSGI